MKLFVQGLSTSLAFFRSLENFRSLAGTSATATIIVIILLSANSYLYGQHQLGPFEIQDRSANPLKPPIYFPTQGSPAIADVDGDGDNDLILGSVSSGGHGIRYFENQGSPEAPVFAEQVGLGNPFYYLIYHWSVTYGAIAPTLGDLDEDGDVDLLVGMNTGELRYYINDGELNFQHQTSPWNPAAKTGNPFAGIFSGAYPAPLFVDFEDDGDLDVLLGSNPDYTHDATIHLLVNDGAGNFTRTDVPGVNPPGEQLSPSMTDYNLDGYPDIVTGDQDGVMRYFENQGDGTFAEQAGWQASLGFFNGTYIAPAFGDFDNDGWKELIIGCIQNAGSHSVFFYQNVAGNSFDLQTGIHAPFGGIDVSNDASPYFTDVDNDGDLDLLAGNNNNFVSYYRNDNGTFNQVSNDENPFYGIVTGDNFSLSYVDLNGDGERDLVGASNDIIQYFKAVDGTFVEENHSTGPFSSISTITESKSDFIDIDGDGDLDLFISDEQTGSAEMGWGFFIRFFENTGTATSPQFEERTGVDNPLDAVFEEYILYPRFRDIDHDGDLDALIGEGGDIHVEMPESNEFLYFENIGSATEVNFIYRGDLIPQYENAEYFAPSFLDFDGDGDMDVFQGDYAGQFTYYRNVNPPPHVEVNGTPLNTEASSGVVQVDPMIIISDPDADEIILARVRITNYGNGDNLTFTWPSTDPGSVMHSQFNSDNGELTISGKANALYYEELLRTVHYHFDNTLSTAGLRAFAQTDVAASMSAGPASKTITFEIFDADFTSGTPAVRVVNIAVLPDAPPVFANGTFTVVAGKTITQDINHLLSDPNGPANINRSSLKILFSPISGAVASLSSAGILTVNYTGVAFTGEETLNVEACDYSGACDEGSITLNVTNNAPLFQDGNLEVFAGYRGSLDLSPLMSDIDDNLEISSLHVIQPAASGAPATIDADQNVLIDFSSRAFTGTDMVRVRICDITGACDDATVSITVTNTPPVIAGQDLSVNTRGTLNLDLAPLISDAENNLLLWTLSIAQAPPSGAVATLSGRMLTVNYSGTNFAGSESVTVRICDIAGACVQRQFAVTVTNTAPALSAVASTLPFGSIASVSLANLVSDADGNLDINSLRIVSGPSSGAPAQISGNVLVVDYAGIAFAGTESVTVEVCDLAGACTQTIFHFTVDNAAPLILPQTVGIQIGEVVSINLGNITSDPDNNLDPSTFEIIETPLSNATASIVNGLLVVDYSQVNFQGTDQLRIRVCDVTGTCTENTIFIEVSAPEGEIRVFNAVAPNGTADNKWMRIDNLPFENKVSVFNRWGDKVFEVENYNDDVPEKRFEGLGDNGRELPGGTYYYKIEVTTTGNQLITGYLSLIK